MFGIQGELLPLFRSSISKKIVFLADEHLQRLNLFFVDEYLRFQVIKFLPQFLELLP